MSPRTAEQPRFSVYYFGSYPRETPAEERYELLFESARFADAAGFHALWIPERHFHPFGGIFPNPSVLAAALARETTRIRLHAGSVVLPLHDPIRVAEEWSVVDNLSGGRVGIGVASGWHANDFALCPSAYGRHREIMYEHLETVQALWRGDAVEAVSGTGERIEVMLYPQPLQPQPPLFTAIVGSPESWTRAGTHDLGVITNLMTQDVDRLAVNVERYRAARAAAGLDPAGGAVVVLLHTYLGTTQEQARADAFEPLCAYLRSSLSLFGQFTNSLGMNIDLEHTPEEDVGYLLERAFDAYCDARALIGTVDSCAGVVERVLDAGVDEIACFVDFGVSLAHLRASLPRMAQLRERFQPDGTLPRAPAPAAAPEWEGDPAPLTLGQESMWFSGLLHGASRGFNEPAAIRLVGSLDRAALAAALNDVVRAQEALRCRIVPGDGVPRQRIRRHIDVELPAIDMSGRAQDVAIAAEMASESARSFDLVEGPLWVARLLRFDAEQHVLFLCLHHLVIDMISLRSLTRQLSRAYAARLRGEDSPLAGVRPAPFSAYARRQRESLASPEVEAAIHHWLQYLTPLPRPLVLPRGDPPPAAFAGEGTALKHRLDRELTADLDAYARTSQATPFMCLVAAYAVALHVLSGQDEIVIGTPIVDRPLQFTDTIGLFVNLLPLRIDLASAASFADVLQRVRTTMLDALEHAAAPFEEVVRRINPPREAGRNPIFQVMIEFGGSASHELDLPGVAATTVDVAPSRSAFELALRVWRQEDELHCHFEYATAQFDHATVAELAATFDRAVRAGLADAQRPLVELVAAAGAVGATAGVERREQPVLFCLPHAGGSAETAYRDWADDLADVVRVVPLELAGRGRRTSDADYASLRAAASDCAARIRAEAGSAPFALFGHSIGGVLAYEIDAALHVSGQPGPAAVIVAGTPPPSRPRTEPPIHDWPDDRFLDAVARYGSLPQAVLDHPLAREFHIAVLRNDFRIIEGYELATPAHRLGAPLLVLQGAADPVTGSEDPSLWAQLAGTGVTTRTIPAGDHFFPATHRSETLATLRGFLTRALA